MIHPNHFAAAKELITNTHPNFEQLLTWVHAKTNEYTPRLKSSKVLSFIDFNTDVHFIEPPKPFNGDIIYLEDAHPEILTRVIFMNKTARGENVWTYTHALVYVNNRIVYDPQEYTSKSLSVLPMNTSTLKYHVRLINKTQVELGEKFTLSNLLITHNNAVADGHDYYPYNLGAVTFTRSNNVEEVLVEETESKTLLSSVDKLTRFIPPTQVSFLIKKVTDAVNETPPPVTQHNRSVFLNKLDRDLVKTELLSLTEPKVMCKESIDSNNGSTSVWLPIVMPNLNCRGVVLNIISNGERGFVTYVYADGTTVTDTKIFDLTPFTNLEDGALISHILQLAVHLKIFLETSMLKSMAIQK